MMDWGYEGVGAGYWYWAEWRGQGRVGWVVGTEHLLQSVPESLTYVKNIHNRFNWGHIFPSA